MVREGKSPTTGEEEIGERGERGEVEGSVVPGDEGGEQKRVGREGGGREQ